MGRFGRTPAPSARAELRFIFSEAAVKIINDFRHLLALIIVLIFAFALGYSLIKAASAVTNATSPTMIDNMKEALQAVVATLGGLVGSIIGYYFGESSVVKSPDSKPADTGLGKSAPVQEPPKEGEQKAPPPPQPPPAK
jgi:Mn2+/Fe2+ NRAMP family transporter